MKLSDILLERERDVYDRHIEDRYVELVDNFIEATNRIDNTHIKSKLYDEFDVATAQFESAKSTDDQQQIYSALDAIQRIVSAAIKYTV